MKTTNKIIKAKDIESTRLDVFLAEKLKISRSQTQKMIEGQQILVNNKPAKKSGDWLKSGDEITIMPKVEEKKLTVKEEKVKQEKFAVKIIAETPDYLVVEKPNGLLTHPTDKNEDYALSTILSKKYPGLKKVGDDEKRPGIVHRLDKEASGLLVVARNQSTFELLKDQFKNRTVEKEYIVLVHGVVAKDWDEIKFPIERSKTLDRMSALPATQRGLTNASGKEAFTEFDVEKRFINFTLLRVKIHTGRMHQIRAHLLAYNHPVVADPLYFQKKRKDRWDKVCGRLFLHCTRLAFIDKNGERQEFNSPLPKKLSDFLLLLK